MIPTSYPCPLPDGSSADEYALSFDHNRPHRLLIIPALLDEGHRLRRLCVAVMRRLDSSGIDSFLPDLPGTNESLANLERLSLSDWAVAAASASGHFAASHVLALRGGGLILPAGLPGWHYGPVTGSALLRKLIRSRVIASREAGLEETGDDAQDRGIQLGGYNLGPAMIRQLLASAPNHTLATIDQDLLGGSPLWLRAEPDDDATQADALAAYLTMAMRG